MPWAEPGSQCTTMFEALVINWLQQASLSAVAKALLITWGAAACRSTAANIHSRAVRRGLARRTQVAPGYVGVD